MSCFKKKLGRVNTLYISNDCEEETFRHFFPSCKQNMQNKIQNSHQKEMCVSWSHNCQTNKGFFPFDD